MALPARNRIVAFLVCLLLAASGRSLPQNTGDAYQAVVDAYVYGFPLVLMDVTKRRMTNNPGVAVNHLFHTRAFPEPSSRNVVSPNADTLYSIAWLDLAAEPMLLHVPDAGNRYYLMQAMDAWTNTFAAPGTRTTGSKAGDFVFAGPNWKSQLPKDATIYRSPTNMVWLLGRIQTNGKNDYAAVRALQDQFQLMPLSARGKPYQRPESRLDPSVDMRTPPPQQVMQMDAATFFARLKALMKENPPAAADAAMVKKLARIDAATPEDLQRAVKAAQESLRGGFARHGQLENGWRIDRKVGTYGNEYERRARTAYAGLGANLVADALYPFTQLDADGQKLTGSNRYVLHFDKEHVPPVRAFWSLTLYGADHFFVPNPIGRYAIGDRDPVVLNADGSLDIYIQNEAPLGKEANWLPAPKDDFNLILRLYWPKEEALAKKWKVPPVRRTP